MTDVGLAALTHIYQQLQIDELWTVRGDREFSWIGHRLRQTLHASKVFHDGDLALSRLTASTVVVEDVSAPEADVLRALAAANRHAIGGAYTYVSSARRITVTAVAYVHKQTLEWRSQQFGAITIMQLCAAETEAEWLAQRTRGRVAVTRHPVSAARDARDDMLNVLDGLFAPQGAGASSFIDQFEFEAIAESTRHSSKAASLGAGANGVSIEVSFGNTTSLTMLKTDEPHRRLGVGLTVRLALPSSGTPEELDRIAASLNTREAMGSPEATHHGAWCWDDWPITTTGIAYQVFMPNALHRQGISQDLMISAVRRAQWADEVLNGRPSTASVWQTIADRMQVKHKAGGTPSEGSS